MEEPERFGALGPLLERLVMRLETLERDHEDRLRQLETVITKASRLIQRALYVATLGLPIAIQIAEIVARWLREGHGGNP